MISRRLLLAATLSPLPPGGANAPVELTHAQPCMGTMFRVAIWARDEDAGYRAIHSAFARADELDAKLSDYKPQSELSALMREGFAKPFPVSEDLFRVMEAAQRLAEETDGLFDISIGPLSRLWRECRNSGRLPTPDILREARSRVGYRHIALDRETRCIRLARAGMQLDLGGIAKGFAADTMRAVLANAGFPASMAASGGDIAVGEAPPRTSGWVVELDPGEEFPGAKALLSLRSRAVSTSGAHRQHFTIDGVTYSHIIDPRTGLGLTRQTAVSVVAPTATQTDALATTASLMEPSAAVAFLSKHAGVSGRVFLPPAGEGRMAETQSTGGFANYLAHAGSR